MRRWLAALFVCAALLAVASVSVTSGDTLAVVDAQGRPQTAYAIYRYQGSRPNFVHPTSYDASPLLVARSGADGRLIFPAAVHVHRPFPLETHPSLWIDMIYVPALHNAGGRMGGGYAASTAGEWEMDEPLRRATVYDLSDRPDRWQGTLTSLSFHIGHLMSSAAEPAARQSGETEVMVRELVGHYRAEYDAFLGRWGETPRPRPAMPLNLADDEKHRWTEMMDEELARHPTWGAEIRRRHERELSALARRVAPR